MHGSTLLTRCLIVALLWQLCPVVAAQAQSDGVQLEWKFKKGQRMALEMEQAMVLQVSVAGRDVETNNVTKSFMTWVCDDIDEEGVYTIGATIDRMTMDLKGPGATRFDTDEGEETGQGNAAGQSVRPMIGVKIKHTMNSRGEVLKIEMPEKMAANLGQLAGPGMGDMVKDMSKQTTLAFPAAPLREGESWTLDSESSSPAGKIAISKTYTYQGIVKQDKKTLHHFDVDVQMEFITSPGGAVIEITDQSTTGNIYFDAEAGRVDHSDVEQVAKFTITVGPQKWEQVLTQTVGMKMKEAKLEVKQAG